MKKFLFLGLFLGFLAGVGGESLIPTKYLYGQTTGCLTDGPYVFMPRGKLYAPQLNGYPLDLSLFNGFIPSYRFMFALLNKNSRWLPAEECNKLNELEWEHNEAERKKSCRK